MLVESLDIGNISKHGMVISFLSGYLWEVLVAMGLAEQQGPDQDAQLGHLEYSLYYKRPGFL